MILHRHREKNFQLIENYCFTQEYDEFYPFTAEQPKPRRMSRRRHEPPANRPVIGVSTAAGGAALLLAGLAAAQGRWETKVVTIARANGPARGFRTGSPTSKATGRTRSRTTTISPILKAGFQATRRTPAAVEPLRSER